MSESLLSNSQIATMRMHWSACGFANACEAAMDALELPTMTGGPADIAALADYWNKQAGLMQHTVRMIRRVATTLEMLPDLPDDAIESFIEDAWCEDGWTPKVGGLR